MKKYLVYIHTNKLNSKAYVGITCHTNPNRRWREGEGYQHCNLFYRAIKKYGWESFSHTILVRNIDKKTAIFLERVLISFYKLQGISYNIGEGGEGTISFSAETRAKLASYTPWIKGRHHTKETIEKIRQSSKRPQSEECKRKISIANSGPKNGMYGKHLSEKHKQLLKTKYSKAVLQFSKEGVFLQRFPSAIEAERTLNKTGGHISSCCTGARKTAYGFIWKYE